MNDPKEPGTSIPDYSAVMLRSLAVFLGMIQAEEGMRVMVERRKYILEISATVVAVGKMFFWRPVVAIHYYCTGTQLSQPLMLAVSPEDMVAENQPPFVSMMITEYIIDTAPDEMFTYW